jgi:hypothetical protein
MGMAFATGQGCGVAAAQFAQDGNISDVAKLQSTY